VDFLPFWGELRPKARHIIDEIQRVLLIMIISEYKACFTPCAVTVEISKTIMHFFIYGSELE
jgi:hypothetical protein